MAKKYLVPINTLCLTNDLGFDDRYIYISSQHISAMKGRKLKRNEEVQVKNLKNGTIIHAPVRSSKDIARDQVILSYELAVDLNVPNIRSAFTSKGKMEGIPVSLRIKKVSALIYLRESVLSGNKVSRILSALAILSVIDTLISIAGRLLDIISMAYHSPLANYLLAAAKSLVGL